MARYKRTTGSKKYGRPIPFSIGPYAIVTGTIVPTVTESDIVTGGKTIIITLTNATWKAAGTGPIGSVSDTQALIDGIDSAQSEGTGWDAVVKVGIDQPDVVRTSNTVATITLDAEATYNITATETITCTVPAVAVNEAIALTASPTFTVTAVSATKVKDIIMSRGVLARAR